MRSLVATAVALFGVACGSSAPADFSLGVDSGAVSSVQGAWAIATVTITAPAAMTGTVALSAAGLPAGATAVFSPPSVAAGATSTLTLAAGSGTPAGTYAVAIGGASGSFSHSANVSWTVAARGTPAIKTVFVILMENHNWSSIQGSASAPYINNTLLPQASWAANYLNVPRIHPSLPNYLWLEAGTNFGVLDDNPPATNHQSTTAHLVTLLQNAGISWKSYQEDIDGSTCPLTASGLYAPKHNPMIYFDDVTGANNPASANCIAHVRPYSTLASDLSGGTVARYNFISPNLCDDMHGASGCPADLIAAGDTWLSNAIPQITASAAYQDGGAILVTWDESEGVEGPIGMIVLSSKAKGGGYHNTIAYSHSATLRTMQEIFAVGPPLGGAAGAPDLADLFTSFP